MPFQSSRLLAVPTARMVSQELTYWMWKHLLNLEIGPQQIAKTFRKFGKAVPDHILAAVDNTASAAAAAVTGTDPAVPSDEYDSSYLSPVTVGSNTLHLDFDTGSADL